MIKAIIFDCFGVILTDALELIHSRLRTEDSATATQVKDLIRASNRGLIDPRESSEQVAALLGITYEQYRQQIADGEVKDAELMAYIQHLRGTYKTAMLSNIGSGSLAPRFTPDELSAHFDAVVASGEVGYAKPDPEIYAMTAEKLGVQPDECIFTDDREDHCNGARAVGMQAILYKDFAQFKADLQALL